MTNPHYPSQGIAVLFMPLPDNEISVLDPEAGVVYIRPDATPEEVGVAVLDGLRRLGTEE